MELLRTVVVIGILGIGATSGLEARGDDVYGPPPTPQSSGSVAMFVDTGVSAKQTTSR